MAALAYLLPPLSGLIAYLTAVQPRIRWHGLQSIALGTAWPLLVYAGAFISPVLTRVAFALGALVWIALLASTAFGANLGLPGVGGRMRVLVAYDASQREPE